jgi:OmpA-OmpF porin, OOP family
MKSCLLSVFLLPFLFFSQSPKEYDDGHGKKVQIPLGDMAFADSLVSYKTGDPAPLEKCRNGKLAVGIPDWDGLDNNFTVLGRGGELVLYFKDNALINIEGIDLYVFELGKYVEETFLSISKDGKKWIEVGKIGGGNAAVDLGDSIPVGEVFRYVKLKDAATFTPQGKDSYPGADIDAVAAVGSARSISISSTLLFNVNQSVLKPEAKKILDTIADVLVKNPKYQLRVEGHCDSTGVKAKNQKLAQDRANSVKTYMLTKLKGKNIQIEAKGYSDEIPVASNSTPVGREKNRRVEIFVIPLRETKPPSPQKK